MVHGELSIVVVGVDPLDDGLIDPASPPHAGGGGGSAFYRLATPRPPYPAPFLPMSAPRENCRAPVGDVPNDDPPPFDVENTFTFEFVSTDWERLGSDSGCLPGTDLDAVAAHPRAASAASAASLSCAN